MSNSIIITQDILSNFPNSGIEFFKYSKDPVPKPTVKENGNYTNIDLREDNPFLGYYCARIKFYTTQGGPQILDLKSYGDTEIQAGMLLLEHLMTPEFHAKICNLYVKKLTT